MQIKNVLRENSPYSLFSYFDGFPNNFILRGVCLDSKVDSFFLMKSSTEFLGYIQTRMIFSVSTARWEIVSTTNDREVLAYMKSSDPANNFPLGLHQWKFLSSNCTDRGDSQLRSLHLHLEVELPGNFCCDGACIDSQLVCNNFYTTSSRSNWF